MADDILVTDIAGILGPEVARQFERELRWQVSTEKLQYYEQVRRNKEAERLSIGDKTWVEGIGQKMLSIPARTYFRWQQAEPGCMEDKTFIKEFYRDNPELRADKI